MSGEPLEITGKISAEYCKGWKTLTDWRYRNKYKGHFRGTFTVYMY